MVDILLIEPARRVDQEVCRHPLRMRRHPPQRQQQLVDQRRLRVAGGAAERRDGFSLSCQPFQTLVHPMAPRGIAALVGAELLLGARLEWHQRGDTGCGAPGHLVQPAE